MTLGLVLLGIAGGVGSMAVLYGAIKAVFWVAIDHATDGRH